MPKTAKDLIDMIAECARLRGENQLLRRLATDALEREATLQAQLDEARRWFVRGAER
jgi:hypothetical protein